MALFMQKRAQLWLLAIVICCWAGAAWTAEVQVAAELDPPQFSLDETARFTITVQGASSAKPEQPKADGLLFRYVGQNSQTSWINGNVLSAIAFNFAVKAERTGQYVVGPVRVSVDGKELATKPVACTVMPEQDAPAAPPSTPPPNSPPDRPSKVEADRIGFIRILPETEKLYVGQLVPFVVKGYFRPDLRISLESAPRLAGDGFLLHALDKEPQQRHELVNGERRTLLTWQGLLSAVKEGAAPLAVEIDTEALLPQQRRRNDDPQGSSLLDDPFLEDLFGSNYVRRSIKLASPEKPMTVRPLPTKNRPASFKGAVGIFSLAVAANPTNGRLGEPIALKMKIAGNGNFDGVQAPELTESKGWKIYPASASFDDQGGGKGEKTFEQAIVPTVGSLTAIPPLAFSYFDPSTEEYVNLSSEPIPLNLQVDDQQESSQEGSATPKVEPRDEGRSPSPPAKQKEVAPPRTEPGEMVRAIQPLYDKRWFQGIMAGAGCCLTAGMLLDLHRKRLEDHPDLVLRKQTDRRLAELWQHMKAAAAAQDQEQFRRHCLEAVRMRAGTAWGRTPAAITLADLQERLPAGSPLLSIFSRLEQSGYAGARLEQKEMEEILQTVQHELDMLS